MCLAPGTVVSTLQTTLSERVVTWKVDVTSPSLQMSLKSEVEKDEESRSHTACVYRI